MPARPNVVLIVADDMGYGDFGCFNSGLSRTPMLDQLAAEGVCLTQHYSGSPVCAPARAALLTGRYPHRTGVIDTYEGLGLDRLALRERTLADVFAANGYATGWVGKWHCGALDERYLPPARGFCECAGFIGGWQDYYRWRLFDGRRTRASDGRYLTDVFSDEAAAFVRRHRSEPFFLHLAYNAPHFPLQAPEADIRPFRETGRFTGAVSTIYGMLCGMDRGVRRVVDALHDAGVAEHTLILFTSDNGPDFEGEGDACCRRFNCGFNGSKTHVYEGGIRVPMILRWPERLDAGISRDAFVHFTDWLPTLAAACGLKPPEGGLPLDGRNMWPQLTGASADDGRRCFWQWNRFRPFVTCNAAMREGNWKLVRPAIRAHMPPSDPLEVIRMDRSLKDDPARVVAACPERVPRRAAPEPVPVQLFDLAADPGEARDLAAAEPARAARMLRELETWFETVERDRAAIDD